MVNPEGVYNKVATETVRRPDHTTSKRVEGAGAFKKAQKLVRMDFGVMNQRKLDENNPVCFETNSALILIQLMKKNTFVALLDLEDGDDNKIFYPFGYTPQDEDSKKGRVLEETTQKDNAENDSKGTPPTNESNIPKKIDDDSKDKTNNIPSTSQSNTPKKIDGDSKDKTNNIPSTSQSNEPKEVEGDSKDKTNNIPSTSQPNTPKENNDDSKDNIKKTQETTPSTNQDEKLQGIKQDSKEDSKEVPKEDSKEGSKVDSKETSKEDSKEIPKNDQETVLTKDQSNIPKDTNDNNIQNTEDVPPTNSPTGKNSDQTKKNKFLEMLDLLNPKNPQNESQGWDLDKVEWSDKDSNWDKAHEKITKSLWKAYFQDANTNEDFLYRKVLNMLSRVGGYNEELSIFTNAKILKEKNKDAKKTDSFNMFIDFAYSASFNEFNISKSCATPAAFNHLKNKSEVNVAFRTFAMSIMFKRDDKTTDQFQGDEKSVRNRLFKYQQQNYNIFDKEKIDSLKQDFGKKQKNRASKRNTFDEGLYGLSSRFIVILLSLADIIQPSMHIEYMGLDKSADIKLYEENSTNKNPYIKSITGDVLVSLRIRGCLDEPSLFTGLGTKLDFISQDFMKDKQEYLVDLKIPFDKFNNPFAHIKAKPSNLVKSVGPINPIDGPKSFGINNPRPPIPLQIKINERINNVRAIKLKLKCKTPGFDEKSLFKKLPQSHFARGLMDSRYYIMNPKTKKIDFKTPDTVFQISIQDMIQFNFGFMVQQKYLSNIDLISDTSLYFRFSDKTSLNSVKLNSLDQKNVIFKTAEMEANISPEFVSSIKLFQFDFSSQQIRFDQNLLDMTNNWALEVKMFGDIGCCTTSTQGHTMMRVSRKDSKGSFTSAKVYQLFFNKSSNAGKMDLDVSEEKINDPYGLIFYDMLGSGIRLHYNGNLLEHSEIASPVYNRMLEKSTQNKVDQVSGPIKMDVDSISSSNEYDAKNLFAFGYLDSVSPTSTPFEGVMCSDRDKYYLQIIPIRNSNMADIDNDSVGNMFIQITLYTGECLL